MSAGLASEQLAGRVLLNIECPVVSDGEVEAVIVDSATIVAAALGGGVAVELDARLRERAFDCIDAGDLGALRPARVLCRGRPPEGED